ncbi:MAG: hypothetical protein V9F04_05670 [Dermatophilaceae bacterium]
MNTRLAAGSGLSDIEAIEVDWLPELLQYPDKFVDLTAPTTSRTVGWTGRPSRRRPADGKLIGYGTDIGPEADLLPRRPLRQAAGLPTDRAEVAKRCWARPGTATSRPVEQFAAKSKVPWMESSGAIFNAMVNQVPERLREGRRHDHRDRATPRSGSCTTRCSRRPPTV